MTPTETGIIVCHCCRALQDGIPRGTSHYIGRAAPRAGLPASKWANLNPLPANNKTAENRADVLRKYRADVLANPELVAALKAGELLGKTLACWCYETPTGPEPPVTPFCHGDVLRELQAELYDPAYRRDTDTNLPPPPAPTNLFDCPR